MKNNKLIELSPEMLENLNFDKHNGIQPFSREIFLLDIKVSGTAYRNELPDLLPRITPGTLLKTLREPDNEYDPQAIALYLDKVKIGYVPRHKNEIISRLMDSGKVIVAKVESCEILPEVIFPGDSAIIRAKLYLVD